MKELIDHIPFIDVLIVGLLVFFVYLGWKNGLPRLVMSVGAIYVGFLLASIYYHLFGVTLMRIFQMKSQFLADFLGFLALDLLVTVLMLALLFSVFGHIDIRGRLQIFDKVGGSLAGAVAGIVLLVIVISVLRVPHERNKLKLDANSGIPAVELFNDGYDHSFLAPSFMKGTPTLLSSVKPMLPPEAQAKGTPPMLETLAAEPAQ